MDAKVIILLVFILFGMIVAYMVANGMVDLTSIFSRVTKSQAQESLGGVKLEVVSPVAGVYYQAGDISTDNDGTTGDGEDFPNAILLSDILKISGKNLNGKMLTISVASPHWKLVSVYDDTSNDNNDHILEEGKTLQFEVKPATDTTALITAGDYKLYMNDGTATANMIVLQRVDTATEPFNMPEFVELIFAVGETAKAEVTIVAEP